MRKICLFTGWLLLFACGQEETILSDDCRDITELITVEEFNGIRSYILEFGDMDVYCNLYLQNPHLGFDGFDAYLNPEVGQRNARCDPAISDFNEMVIQTRAEAFIYYHILAVRKGDLENEEIAFDFLEGMRENRVYLLRYADYDLEGMEEEVQGLIATIKSETGI